MIECDYCGNRYDGTAYRWLCPVCHLKSSCCEGEAQPLCELPTPQVTRP